MKKFNWFESGILAILIISVGGLIYGVVEYNTSDPLKVRESYQKNLEYIGFDGKKHQAIVINTGQHSWVLVEKK